MRVSASTKLGRWEISGGSGTLARSGKRGAGLGLGQADAIF
jgi:hypothetical protein